MKNKISLCPCCGQECSVKEYFDERGLIETDIKCNCGYHYSWAYGSEEITYPIEIQ